jgi:serine/threonine protein kinase
MMKTLDNLLPELASSRLVASLRQPGFIPQYRTFVVDGPSFAQWRERRDSLIAAVFDALRHASDRDAKYWRKFDGAHVDVLVVCMGLGDRGALDHVNILNQASHDASTVRQWLFTLQWSLLVAARTFNFTHRDIKLANMVLSDEGAGRTTFQVTLSAKERTRLGLSEADVNAVRHFCIERQAGELSACVPKFIDLGFASYVVSSVRPFELDVDPLPGTHDPPLFGNVNGYFADIATMPSPDMLFLEAYPGALRDFDSDLFTFGLAALELMAGSASFVWDMAKSAAPGLLDLFKDVALNALEFTSSLPHEQKRVREVVKKNGRYLVAYMQLLFVLRDQVLPPEQSPLRQTLLFRVLNRSAITELVMMPMYLEPLRARLGKIESIHGREAIDYLRACLTWDKSSRGVFPGSPPVRHGTPGTMRLLWHAYFAPLRSSASQAAASNIDNHFVLKYRDPPTSRDALNAPVRFARVTRRIVSVERGLQQQVSQIVSGNTFEIEMDSFVAAVLSESESEAPSTPSMTLTDESDADAHAPLRKRARTLPDTCAPSPLRARWGSEPPSLLSLWADEELWI